MKRFLRFYEGIRSLNALTVYHSILLDRVIFNLKNLWVQRKDNVRCSEKGKRT